MRQVCEETDPMDIDEIFRRYEQPLTRLAFSLLWDPFDAQDVVQDVLISVWSRRGGLIFGSDGELWGFLARSVRNRSIDYLRKRRPLEDPELLENMIEHSTGDASADLAARQEQAIFNACLQGLGQREAIGLRLQRVKIRVMADLLGVSLGGVEKVLQRAVKALRECFKRMTASTV
jgi:RNA polymerase sigma-70 factor, ECF subfamily